jgi:hypothetical protein
MATRIAFEIDADGNLSMKVGAIDKTAHGNVDKLLTALSDGSGGERKTHEKLPPIAVPAGQRAIHH